MEVLAQVLLSTLWWAASLTIFLPFTISVIFSEAVRDKWFFILFTHVMSKVFSPKMRPLRKKAFEMLKNSLPSKNNKTIEILEIGIGGGGNLEFYPPYSRLTANDIDASFEKHLLDRLKKYPDIMLRKSVFCGAEDMKEHVEDNSMDVVVSTSVLCSVANVSVVLSEVKRVLKPGGLFLFAEHIAYNDCKWKYGLQLLMAPLWKLFVFGCNLGRSIDEEVLKTGFSDVLFEKTLMDIPIIAIRPHIIGIAVK